MSVAADIILIITAIQSNGNLSYTLNVFKTKHFLKRQIFRTHPYLIMHTAYCKEKTIRLTTTLR